MGTGMGSAHRKMVEIRPASQSVIWCIGRKIEIKSRADMQATGKKFLGSDRHHYPCDELLKNHALLKNF
jgi:hypothetical protein